MSAILSLFLIAAAPQEGVVSRLFAATSEGPYVSYSWGEHWTRLRGDLRGFTGEIRSFLCLAPTVYAGGSDGLFVSDDFGELYRKVERFPGASVTTILSARLFALEPTLFVGTESGLFHSKDGGVKWARLGEGFLEGTVHDIVWPGPELFVAGDDGLFVSRDIGESWEGVDAGLPDAPITAIALSEFFGVDPQIFAGTRSEGLYRSRDGGERFEPVGKRELGGASVNDLFWWGSLLVVASSEGLLLSDDAGESFRRAPELEGRNVLSISVPGAESHVPSDLIVGTDGGVFKSSDGATSFRAVLEGMGPIRVLDLATFPLPPQSRERRRRR